jgi:diguanylate cyclase (GGDEF)-like protein/PAS domain S-box-containing protein
MARILSRLSLRTFLVLPILLQTLGLVGLVGWLAYRGEQQWVDYMAEEWMAGLSDRVHHTLQDPLDQIQTLTATHQLLGQHQQLSLDRPADLNAYLRHQLQRYPYLTTLALVDPTGQGIILTRPNVTSSEASQGSGAWLGQQVSSRLQAVPRLSFTPTLQPQWAIALPNDPDPLSPGLLSYTLPWSDAHGRLQGMAVTQMPLHHLSALLQSAISRQDQVLIINRQGDIVATSLGTLPSHSASVKGDTASHPLVQSIAQTLQAEKIDLLRLTSPRSLTIEMKQDNYFLKISPLHLSVETDLDWLVVIGVPESRLMPPLGRNLQGKIILLGTVLLIVIALGVALTNRISQAVGYLRDRAKQLAAGTYQPSTYTPPTQELQDMVQAFDQMAQQLQESLANLRSLNQTLLQSEARLAQFLDTLPIGVIVYSANGQVSYYNAAAQRLLGDDLCSCPAQAAGHLYQAGTNVLYPPEHLPIVRALQGEAIAIDNLELRQGDQIQILEVRGTPIISDADTITHAVLTVQDITARKHLEKILADYSSALEQQVQQRTKTLENEIFERQRIEAALRLSEQQQQLILQAIPDLMFRINRDGVYLGYVRTNSLVDLLPGDFNPVGEAIAKWLPPEVYERQMRYIQQALDTGTIQHYEQETQVQNRIQYEEVRVVPSGSHEVLFIVRDVSDRKRAEMALQQSEATQRAILSAIPDLMLRVDDNGILLDLISPGEITQYRQQHNQPGATLGQRLPPDLAQKRLHYIRQAIETGDRQIYDQTIALHGEERHEEVRIVKLTHQEVLVMVRDVTDRKRAEQTLWESQRQFQSAFDYTAVGMGIVGLDGHFLQVNQALCQIFGYPEAELIHRNWNDITDPLDVDSDRPALQAVLTGRRSHYHTEKRYRHRDGSLIWGLVSISLVRNDMGRPLYFVMQLQDITLRKQVEEDLRLANHELEHLATMDGLTQIANRRCFDQYLHQVWERSRPGQQPISLILFDVDHFKLYNDDYGHIVGDQCLQRIAAVAQESVRKPVDLLARYGGEEFAVILPGTSKDGATRVAQRLRQAIQALAIPHRRSPTRPIVTISIGIATAIPSAHTHPDCLIHQADQALYRAKQQGRDRMQSTALTHPE